MTSAILLNRRKTLINKAPEFEYTGDYLLVETSGGGKSWRYAFTSSGVLTLKKKILKAFLTIQAAGGGGGSSDGEAPGSDGSDGDIERLEAIKLEAGSYEIVIGAGGERGLNSAGKNGGDTIFGDLLFAQGGVGGAYAGGQSDTHIGAFQEFGVGGSGGGVNQYEGTLITEYYITINTSGYTYIRVSPKSNAATNGVVRAGEYVLLEDDTKYPDEGGKDEEWYKLADGRGYVSVDRCTLSTQINDTRKWYGVAGNSGVVLLSGKA